MAKLKELYLKYKQYILYLVFGGLTTVVSWGSYSLFVRFGGLSVAVGNALSWVCAVLFAFFVDKIFVFESKSWSGMTVLREIVSFFGARGVTGVLEIVAVPALVKLGLDQTLFGTRGMLAKILVSVVIVILNFLFSKFLVFRKKKTESE